METEEAILKASDVRVILETQGCSFASEVWEKLENWIEILEGLNRRVNLVSRKEIQRIWGRHVLPCVSLLHFRNLPIGVECCDFGSGGGFPGIPLAICRPDLKMFLLDSRRRKCDALEEMVKSLELKNVEVLCGRGEELGKTRKWNQRFPVIFARAVASLEQLETWTREMRKSDAEIHVFKGGDLKQEFQALHQNQPRVRWNQTLLDFEEFPFLSDNQKYIITLNFTSN